jgi:hypothetical protein
VAPILPTRDQQANLAAAKAQREADAEKARAAAAAAAASDKADKKGKKGKTGKKDKKGKKGKKGASVDAPSGPPPPAPGEPLPEPPFPPGAIVPVAHAPAARPPTATLIHEQLQPPAVTRPATAITRRPGLSRPLPRDTGGESGAAGSGRRPHSALASTSGSLAWAQLELDPDTFRQRLLMSSKFGRDLVPSHDAAAVVRRRAEAARLATAFEEAGLGISRRHPPARPKFAKRVGREAERPDSLLPQDSSLVEATRSLPPPPALPEPSISQRLQRALVPPPDRPVLDCLLTLPPRLPPDPFAAIPRPGSAKPAKKAGKKGKTGKKGKKGKKK